MSDHFEANFEIEIINLVLKNKVDFTEFLKRSIFREIHYRIHNVGSQCKNSGILSHFFANLS